MKITFRTTIIIYVLLGLPNVGVSVENSQIAKLRSFCKKTFAWSSAEIDGQSGVLGGQKKFEIF